MPTTEPLELMRNAESAAGVENGMTGTVIAVVGYIDIVTVPI